MKHSNKLMTVVGIALMGLALNASAAIQGDTSRVAYDNVQQSASYGFFVPPAQLKDHTLHDLGYSDIRE